MRDSSDKVQESGMTILEQQSLYALYSLIYHHKPDEILPFLVGRENMMFEFNSRALALYLDVNHNLELFEEALEKKAELGGREEESMLAIWITCKRNNTDGS